MPAGKHLEELPALLAALPRLSPEEAKYFGDDLARAQLWAELSADGVIIGPHDLWLAAACIANGLTIVTTNARELAVESWSAAYAGVKSKAPSPRRRR